MLQNIVIVCQYAELQAV